jgi:hypothetical protein
MNKSFANYLFFTLFFTILSDAAFALTFGDLTGITPKCKLGKIEAPKIRPDFKQEYPKIFRLDFNGDGFCDYALGLPVPINEKMTQFNISEIFFVQNAGTWISAFAHRKPWHIVDFDYQVWPYHDASLLNVDFIYSKLDGLPFVLGLYAKSDDEGAWRVGSGSCFQYVSVHKWDKQYNSLKRVPDEIRDVVLNYFYTFIKKPCRVDGKGTDGIIERAKEGLRNSLSVMPSASIQ